LGSTGSEAGQFRAGVVAVIIRILRVATAAIIAAFL
jgi:hypothetical protein